jgi:small subunit ribosomal protein S20
MPNTKSAAKAARQSERRTARNRSVKSQVKTSEKKFLEAVASGDANAAGAAYKEAVSAFAKAAKRNVIKGGRSSRKQSRLQLKLNSVLVAK